MPDPSPAKEKPSTSPPDAPRPGRGGRHRLAKGLVAFAIAVVASEIALQALGLGHPVLYVADPGCGYLPAPNQHVHRFFAENTINSQCMRSGELHPKSPGTFRILFVGDSVVYGQTYTDQSKIFTSILNRELPALLHEPVEVFNASAGGWAVGNELGYIRSRGTFDSDMVVLVLNTSDLMQAFNGARAGELFLPVRNPPCAIVEAWSYYLRPRIFGASDAETGVVRARTEVQSVPATLAQLETCRVFVRERGARLGVVYSPVIELETGAYIALHTQSFGTLAAWAAANDVPLLDLEFAFAAEGVRKIYRDNIHLAPFGNAVVARQIEGWDAIVPAVSPRDHATPKTH